jgi:hypothetical protein
MTHISRSGRSIRSVHAGITLTRAKPKPKKRPSPLERKALRRDRKNLSSKCRTSTFLPTKFSSFRTSRSILPKINSILSSLSTYCVPLTTVNAFLNILRYENLLDVRVIPAKKDIAFVEYMDERSATIAKEALHNYKIDGENKIKVWTLYCLGLELIQLFLDYLRTEMMLRLSLRTLLYFYDLHDGGRDHCTQIPCLPINSLPLSVTP